MNKEEAKNSSIRILLNRWPEKRKEEIRRTTK